MADFGLTFGDHGRRSARISQLLHLGEHGRRSARLSPVLTLGLAVAVLKVLQRGQVAEPVPAPVAAAPDGPEDPAPERYRRSWTLEALGVALCIGLVTLAFMMRM